MLLFFALAACMPAHAAALNDRSLMPPMSVTMQACAALPPALAPLLAPLLLAGGFPQAAAASTRPPTARTPTSRIPRTGRKTISLPCPHRIVAVVPTAGSVRQTADSHLVRLNEGFGPLCQRDQVVSGPERWITRKRPPPRSPGQGR